MQHKINESFLLTDENIQAEIVDFLRNNNFNVVDIKGHISFLSFFP